MGEFGYIEEIFFFSSGVITRAQDRTVDPGDVSWNHHDALFLNN